MFCLIYSCLDAVWDESKDPRLVEYLSDANPFLFKGIGSAVSYVYHEFCEHVPEKVPLEDSYAVAADYIATLDNDAVKEAFASFGRDRWIEGTREYLSSDHKGREA